MVLYLQDFNVLNTVREEPLTPLLISIIDVAHSLPTDSGALLASDNGNITSYGSDIDDFDDDFDDQDEDLVDDDFEEAVLDEETEEFEEIDLDEETEEFEEANG